MGFFLVLKAEVVRMMIIMRRYWFATLVGIAIGYGMLITIIFGFMAGGSQMAEAAGEFKLGAQAVNGALGFVAGIWAFGIVGLFTQGLQGMMRTGELEQLCMSPFGLVTNFLARSMVMGLNSIFSLAVMIWLVSITVKSYLTFQPFLTVLLAALAFINLIGFGFLCGGLVLVFKQTGQIAMLIRLAMIGASTLATTNDISKWPIVAQALAHALPITDASICFKLILIDGAGYDVLQHSSFYFLIMSCVIWTFLGITLFRWMETYSRTKGTLGAY